MVTWKRDFASGLIVLVPLIITFWVLLWLFRKIQSLPTFPIKEELDGISIYGVDIPNLTPAIEVLLTILVFVLIVFAVGYLMRTAVGTVVENRIDQVMNRLPGLRVVYNASKMAAETALTGTDSLQTPVKVETWEGMRMTAFKTGKQTEDGREMLFMPTAPNITTGFVVEVKPEDIEEVDERVEEALTRLLSAGFGDSNSAQVQVEALTDADDDTIEGYDDSDEQSIGGEQRTDGGSTE